MIPRILLLTAGLIFSTGFIPAMAAFVTGFESSSGYSTPNATVIGVHDNAASGTNSWVRMFGGDAQMTSATAHPESGTQALQFVNDGVSGALGSSLDLGTSINTANPMSISFGLAIESVGTPTSNHQLSVSLGTATSTYDTNPMWFRVGYNNGTLQFLIENTAGTLNALFNIGAYTDYTELGGDYVNFDIGINSTTGFFSKLIVSGSKSTVDWQAAWRQRGVAERCPSPEVRPPPNILPSYRGATMKSPSMLIISPLFRNLPR